MEGSGGFVWFMSVFAIYLLIQAVCFPNQGTAST